MQHRKIMTAMVVALMLLAGVSALSFAGPNAASEDRAADVEYGGIELTPEQAAINEQIEQRGRAQQDAEAALLESGVNVYGLDDETLSSLGDNRTVVEASVSAAATPANGSAEQLGWGRSDPTVADHLSLGRPLDLLFVPEQRLHAMQEDLHRAAQFRWRRRPDRQHRR
jgi:hypothetical protein